MNKQQDKPDVVIFNHKPTESTKSGWNTKSITIVTVAVIAVGIQVTGALAALINKGGILGASIAVLLATTIILIPYLQEQFQLRKYGIQRITFSSETIKIETKVICIEVPNSKVRFAINRTEPNRYFLRLAVNDQTFMASTFAKQWSIDLLKQITSELELRNVENGDVNTSKGFGSA